MPKLKTNRAAAKRFKQTASGRIKHRQSHRSHILTKKSATRKRHLRSNILIDVSDERAVKRMAPYL
ncbi:MAG: 50S ribosomal protein L35 [Gammaproteobacteria bacterium]